MKVIWVSLVLCTLLTVGNARPYSYSSICLPYDEGVDLYGFAYAYPTGTQTVAKNWWVDSPTTLPPVVGGTIEYSTNRTVSLGHAVYMISVEISGADCDYYVRGEDFNITLRPGVNCWVRGATQPSYHNVVFDGLSQSDPKFIVSIRDSNPVTIMYITFNSVTFQNGATIASKVVWSTVLGLLHFRTTAVNDPIFLPGSYIGAAPAFVLLNATTNTDIRWHGQFMIAGIAGSAQFVSNVAILGEPPRIPVCNTQILDGPLYIDTLATINTYTTDSSPPAVIKVNGNTASAVTLDPDAWQVTGNKFVNDTTYTLIRDARMDVCSKISRMACTRMVDRAIGGTYTQDITIFPGEVVCIRASVRLTGTLIFDAQGDPNAVFVFQGTEFYLNPESGNTFIGINGTQSKNIYIVAYGYVELLSSLLIDQTTVSTGHIMAQNYIYLSSNITHYGDIFSGDLIEFTETDVNIQPHVSTVTEDSTDIAGAQVSCAGLLRSCTITGSTNTFAYPNGRVAISSINALDSAVVTYDVQLPQETYFMPALTHRWLCTPNVSVQPVGSWDLGSARNGTCDNTTLHYPVNVYNARFTSTFREMYVCFAGAPYSLTSVEADIFTERVKSLSASGTLQIGSIGTKNCTVNLLISFVAPSDTTAVATETSLRYIVVPTVTGVVVLVLTLLLFVL
jgi:hypothetical protein